MRAAGLFGVVGVATIAVACSSGTKKTGGGSLATGNYSTSNFASTNDACGIATDPGSVDLFVTGNDVVYDSAYLGAEGATLSGSTLSATTSQKSYDQDPGFGSGLFCTINTTDSIAGSVSGSTVDVTETYTTTVSGPQCALDATTPCTTVMTYTLTRAGATINPTPNPTPTSLTGTGSATSDSSFLSGDYTVGPSPSGNGQSLQYQMGLTGGAGITADSNWYCFHDPVNFSDNYAVVETTNFNFTMLVSTGSWSVGDHPVDPDNTVYLSISGSNGEIAVATAGTLHIATAGKTPDTSSCKFSFSGVTFGADVTPFRAPAPHRARKKK